MANDLKSNQPIFLVGATGTGKSAAAVELARKLRAAILCMDAMQVYRGADIGTSKPMAAERAEIPHGGLDLVDFGASFDVAQYLKHAEDFLQKQRQAGKRVIIVGGTGLYFRALTRGLCEAPQGSEKLRAELAMLSVGKMQDRLREVDPEMLKQIDVLNPRRLARAIEVIESTGRSLREWQEETPEPLVHDFTAVWIQREKKELHERLVARVEAMFAQGWVEEVQKLMKLHGLEAVRTFPGIGYREVAETQAKLILRQAQDNGSKEKITMATAMKKLKSDIFVSTRQYAKRQLTWFAREPILHSVMLTGDKPLSAALRATAADLL